MEIIKKNSVEGLLSLPDGMLDFIYIDTDHKYVTTNKELAIAHFKIKPGGFITGHDYKDGRYDYRSKKFIPYGVIRAVNEFMAREGHILRYLSNEPDQFLSFALRRS